MNSTDTTSRKNFDARAMGDPNRRSDRRGAVPALCDGERNVASADLPDVFVFRQRSDLIVVESDSQLAIDNGDGRRHSSSVTHYVLQTLRCLQVLWTRQAMRDHCRLKRYNRPTIANRLRDFRSD